MGGRAALIASAVAIGLLVGSVTYVAIGGTAEHTAIGRVALNDLVVRWPHQDAATETGVTRLRSQEALATAAESTDDGVIERLSSELPQNQTIFDVVVRASNDKNSRVAADAVADWLVADSLERRRRPTEVKIAELEAVVAAEERTNDMAAAAFEAAESEEALIIAKSELETSAGKLTRSETALAELEAELALIESEFLIVGRASTEEPSNARTVTALAAGLCAGFLTIALAQVLRARRESSVASSDDG